MTSRRTPLALRAETVGQPMRVSSLARMLLQLGPAAAPPALRLVTTKTNESRDPLPALEQRPV